MYLAAIPTQKETRHSLFISCPRDVYLRENGSILSRETILFLVRSTMYAHSIFMVPKSKADLMSLLYFIVSSVQTEKASKNTFAT